MRYDNPELVDRLASAYVLGTLSGRARQRFERLMQESMVIRESVWTWERRLNPLADGQEPVHPDAAVWDAVEQRLFAQAKPSPQGSIWWQLLSGALAVAVIALALPLLSPPAPDGAEQIALIQDDAKQPLWVVSVDMETGTLRTRAINEPAREADRVFELWMLPEQGAPRSFGLLPTAADGRISTTLSRTLLALLGNAQGLAVSVEPLGGSNTGAPTGPVVFVAPVLEL